jgi:putative transposase
VIQSLKQAVARRSQRTASPIRWQVRYYDFNVFSERKRVEKLRYMHRNPVERGLVQAPEEWEWSSFRHYLTGEKGRVEIESHWTAALREEAGFFPIATRSSPKRTSTTPP